MLIDDAMEPRFELRDHTADVILYVEAPTLESLFAEAARGLYFAVGELATTDETVDLRIELQADRTEDLLRDWLAELLFRFDADHLIADDLSFDSFDKHHLIHQSQAKRMDAVRSIFDREVKAITYHDLHVEEKDGGFRVSIILDI